jgi:hypothetical protein
MVKRREKQNFGEYFLVSVLVNFMDMMDSQYLQLKTQLLTTKILKKLFHTSGTTVLVQVIIRITQLETLRWLHMVT